MTKNSSAEGATSDRLFVSDEALAVIIGLAAHEVPGVVGMAPATIGEGLRRILGVTHADEGVQIERGDEDGHATFALHVVVAYGVNIPVVAKSIRDRVEYASRVYAGVVADDVRIHVAGVSRA